jgi:hypothetical protein
LFFGSQLFRHLEHAGNVSLETVLVPSFLNVRPLNQRARDGFSTGSASGIAT